MARDLNLNDARKTAIHCEPSGIEMSLKPIGSEMSQKPPISVWKPYIESLALRVSEGI